MPTRNINLTAEQSAFVDRAVRSGRYQNASEAIRDALRILEQHQQEQAMRLELLRAQLSAGADALERGEFVEIEASAAALEALVESPRTAASRGRRVRRRR